MENLHITDMAVVPCTNSRYIKPSRVVFKQNGHKRAWDYMKTHDSVSILIYNTTKQSIVLVKQFRPAVYMHINRTVNSQLGHENEDREALSPEDESFRMTCPVSKGVTYELCAGLVDKNNASLATIAKQEILEECGYDVQESNVIKIMSSYHAVGIAGSLQTSFYTEVTDDMKVSEGGGNHSEGEVIELFYLPVSKIREFISDETKAKPPGLILSLLWFLDKHQQKCCNL